MLVNIYSTQLHSTIIWRNSVVRWVHPLVGSVYALPHVVISLFRDSDFEDLATGHLLSLGPMCGTLFRPKLDNRVTIYSSSRVNWKHSCSSSPEPFCGSTSNEGLYKYSLLLLLLLLISEMGSGKWGGGGNNTVSWRNMKKLLFWSHTAIDPPLLCFSHMWMWQAEIFIPSFAIHLNIFFAVKMISVNCNSSWLVWRHFKILKICYKSRFLISLEFNSFIMALAQHRQKFKLNMKIKFLRH